MDEYGVFFRILSWLIVLLVSALYSRTVHLALERCSAEDRRLAPKLAWLLVVPYVSGLWHFVVAEALLRSWRAERVAGGRTGEEGFPFSWHGRLVSLGFLKAAVVQILRYVYPYQTWPSGIRTTDLVTTILFIAMGIWYWARVSRWSASLLTQSREREAGS